MTAERRSSQACRVSLCLTGNHSRVEEGGWRAVLRAGREGGGAWTWQICQIPNLFPGQHGAASGWLALSSAPSLEVAEIWVDHWGGCHITQKKEKSFHLPYGSRAAALYSHWIQHRSVGLFQHLLILHCLLLFYVPYKIKMVFNIKVIYIVLLTKPLDFFQ